MSATDREPIVDVEALRVRVERAEAEVEAWRKLRRSDKARRDPETRTNAWEQAKQDEMEALAALRALGVDP